MYLNLVPVKEFKRIRQSKIPLSARLQILSDMARINALTAVKRAGSGHLGSSLSAMDIVTYLYNVEMNTIRMGIKHKDRDIYFSSKGHDVPGLYAVLHSLEIIPTTQLLKLRRLGGLDGHPDIEMPGIEANTGSLGMGISKGRGMAYGKAYTKRGGYVYILTGDGELQEGQIYEALQTTAQQQTSRLIVIVDHNKVQSDKEVRKIVDLRDLKNKFACFGWKTLECNGHNFSSLARAIGTAKKAKGPAIIIANTIKGKGVSFMEHPRTMAENNGIYKWHSGAPGDEPYQAACTELLHRINSHLSSNGEKALSLEKLAELPKNPSLVTPEYVANAYGKALVAIAKANPKVIVLDADLACDCRVREFELTYPNRFIENGIAEQDMVSMAGGIARQGLIPVVNSFASFLASRSNEQIYNNATENCKIIYACHYAGLIPAGPGKSHQSIRDISLFGALPNVTILQPCCAAETDMVVKYCIDQAKESCVIRLIIGPSPEKIELPSSYKLSPGKGVILTQGKDAVLFAYGPVMLHEALVAQRTLKEKAIRIKVVNMPWLNRVDISWLKGVIGKTTPMFVLEDHAPVGGLGDFLISRLVDSRALNNRIVAKFAVEGYPAFGTPQEALQFHGIDGASLAKRIAAAI